jgi:hypothetical protein
VGAELIWTERRTNGQTDMMKLVGSFYDFAKAPKNCSSYRKFENAI